MRYALAIAAWIICGVIARAATPDAVRVVEEDELIASALQPANGVEWCMMTVQVVDAQGSPIEGATVRPWALRAGNGHGTWNETMGAPRETVTGRDGQTSVVYPKEIAWRNEVNPVVSVSIIVKHAEFVARNVHVSTGPADVVTKLDLKPGVRLRVAGVEPGADKPLDHCYLTIENPDAGGQEFVREASGWLQSSPISQDRRWFRVIHAAPDQPPRFSQLLAWTPDDPTTRERLVEVRTGTRVEGKVSDDVPRPIRRGHVVACCGSPKHAGDEQILNWRPIYWSETVPIGPNGTFVFESLPSGYLVQFYAFANDFISAQPTDDAYQTCCRWFGEAPSRNDIFRYGQILRLTGGHNEMTIQMEPAGEVRVKCIGPDGQPLRGIFIATSPNQYLVGGGSNVFCSTRSSLSGLLVPSGKRDPRESSIYTARTGEDGMATIRNLPTGEQTIVAGSPLWVGDAAEARSNPGRPAELVLELRRRP